MTNFQDPQLQPDDDEKLISFLNEFSKSGFSLMHITAQNCLKTGAYVEFLQETFDHYTSKSMYDLFTLEQREEYEYFIVKYGIMRKKRRSPRL